ncbi:MAG TPA: PAS domain S-box protein, partial [bacterium]|nr:PAS domain S-box protein [bacterium]
RRSGAGATGVSRQDEYRAWEGELQTYFEAGLDLFCIIDRQGCFRRLNRQWESTLGYAAAALAGRQFMAYVHPDDVALTAAALARCAQTTQNYTNRYRHADGSYRWLEWRVCAHDPMLYAAARDITARKHNEEQLRQFRFMVEYAGQEIYLARPDGTLAYVNRTAAAGLGYTQAELQRLGVAGIDDGFGPVFAQHFAELKRGDLPPFVTWHRAKDGRLIPKEMKSFYLQIGDDEFICGFAQDITARRQAEEELRIKNLAFAASIAGSSVADQDGIIRYVNEAFLAMWGFVDHAAATGRPQAEFFSEPREAQAILTALIENGRWQGVFTAKRRDGTTFLAETRATAIRDSQGVLVGYQAACLDVTDRVRMEQALRASEERLRRLMENAPDMIFHMTLPEGRYEYVSRAAHEITGYRPEDFYRNPQMIADMIPAEWQGYFAAEWKKLLAGEVTPSYEFQFRTAAGELRWANQRNVPIRDGHGVLLGIEGIVTDVTERKQAETARLRRQEELERFERLAMGREKKMIELKQTIAALRQQLAARGGGET